MFLHLCVGLQGIGTYVSPHDIPVDTCTCYAVCACGHIPVGVPTHVLTQVFVLMHMSRDARGEMGPLSAVHDPCPS